MGSHVYNYEIILGFSENRVAFRWRTEKEVISGKGQFVCAQKKVCAEKCGLRTWEVNFGYAEDGVKKDEIEL